MTWSNWSRWSNCREKSCTRIRKRRCNIKQRCRYTVQSEEKRFGITRLFIIFIC